MLKLNVRMKMLAGFGLTIVLLLAVFGVGLRGLNTVGANADEIAHVKLPEIETISHMELLLAEQEALFYEYAATGLVEVGKHAEEMTNEVDEGFATLYRQFQGQPETLRQIEKLEGEYVGFVTTGTKLGEAYANKNASLGLVEMAHELDAEFVQMEQELTTLAAEVNAGVEHAIAAGQSSQKSATTLMVALAVIAALSAAAIAWLLATSISTAVKKVAGASTHLAEKTLPSLAATIKAVAEGDLSTKAEVKVEEVKVKSKDEIGEMARQFNLVMQQVSEIGMTVNGMVDQLGSVVSKVQHSASTMADSSAELLTASTEAGKATAGIATGSQQVAKGATDQAQSAEQTRGSMQELSKAIEQIAAGSVEQAKAIQETAAIVTQVSKATGEVAKSAQSAANSSRETKDIAVKGMAAVEETVAGMDRIRGAVDAASTKIADLGKQSQEIGKIVAVIDDIAAQTNLLALNAAIEAARAGEQGRGFAVVADEVRKLAERVTDATKEIGGLVETIQTGVSDSVQATQQGTKEVEAGAKLADASGMALKTILSSVEKVGQQLEQISAATEEVSAAADSMVKAIDRVSSSVEQNTAAAEEMTAQSGEVGNSMESVSAAAQESSAAAEEASAAAEEISAQVQQVSSSSQRLAELAKELQDATAYFKLAGANRRNGHVEEPVGVR